MPENPHRSESREYARRRTAGLAVLVLVVLTVAAVAIPIWIIRPFEAQTPGGIELAYVLRRWAPAWTLAAAAVVFAAMVWLWRGAAWWRRTLLVLSLLLIAALAWATRQNLFEKMFVPLTAVRFAPAADAGWVDAADMVLAVDLGGESAAYPVRQIAYHHVVQDTVGGVPIVATY